MGDKKIRLLLVEDDKSDQMAFERFVKDEKLSYEYTIAGSIAESKKLIDSKDFDIAISDYMLGDGTLFDLFDRLKDIPVIVTTGAGDEETAVKAMKLGARDYLIKDLEGRYLQTLPFNVEIVLDRKRNEEELRKYRKRLELQVKERTAKLEEQATGRKQSEEALRLNEEKYRILFDMGPDALAVIEIETGDMLDVNKVFIERYGYSRDEILGMKNTDFSVEPEKTKQATLARGTHIPIRYHRKKDGTVFPTEITASNFKYQGRNVLIVALRDITERKQAEEALEESEAYLQSVFRAAPIGIGVVSQRVFQEVNHLFCQLVGYPRDELISQNSRMLYCSDAEYDQAGIVKYRQIEKDGVGLVETRMRRKNGDIINILLGSSPLNPDDLLEGVTFTALDITESKKATDALRDSENRFRDIAYSMADWIWEIDKEGRYTYVSDTVKTFLGIYPKS